MWLKVMVLLNGFHHSISMLSDKYFICLLIIWFYFAGGNFLRRLTDVGVSQNISKLKLLGE